MEHAACVAEPRRPEAEAPLAVTVFVCANCARPARAPSSGGRPRPAVPDFAWPIPVREVAVSCTGRLQPEHVLKAFESGADAVCAVACREDNCHYLEGSKRCARRVDAIRLILREIGLDARRLMLFSLPGTAAEDLALSLGKPAPAYDAGAVDAQTAAICKQVIETLASLPPNPLREPPPAGETEDSNQEVDASYDDIEQ
jgi:coenzyme F420-reducing hydrogenase delta subunit